MSVLKAEQKWNVSKARGEIKEKGRLGQLLAQELLRIIDDLSKRLERLENATPEIVRKQRPAGPALVDELSLEE